MERIQYLQSMISDNRMELIMPQDVASASILRHKNWIDEDCYISLSFFLLSDFGEGVLISVVQEEPLC